MAFDAGLDEVCFQAIKRFVFYFEIVSRRLDRSARGNSRADRFGFGLRFLACASLQLEVVDA